VCSSVVKMTRGRGESGDGNGGESGERSVKGSGVGSAKERESQRIGMCNDLVMSELNYDSGDIIRTPKLDRQVTQLLCSLRRCTA
jgi:hypothetical protein